MPRSLQDFLHKHDGQTAWVFGKGPSLDRFDMAEAGPLRCAINDVVQAVPGCVYCFANDSVRAWAHVYQPHHILFQPARVLHDHPLSAGGLVCERIGFDDDYGDERVFQTREQLARQLSIRRGTLNSALQILHIMGVARIVAVGIDGGGDHATGVRWFTRKRNEHFRDYNAIRNQFLLGARQMGIALEFRGGPDNQPKNGMITVRLTRNISIKGESFYIGEIAEVTPEDAAIIVGARKGEIVRTAPREPTRPMDTAAVEPRTEVTSATRPKPKRTRKTAAKK